jgi:hypothetical protein
MNKLIYAILDSQNSDIASEGLLTEETGVAGAVLYPVSFKNISAIVSNCGPGKQTWVKKSVLEFAGVIEKLSEHTNLLPVRYGTMLQSDEVIRQLLQSHYDAFKSNLKKVANKAEFGLKVLWDYEKLKNEIKEKSGAVEIKSGDYFKQNTVHTNYLLGKMKRHKLDDAVLQYVEKFIEEINHSFIPLNPETKFKKLVSDSIMLDAVFLIEKSKHNDFKAIIEIIGQQHADFQFLLTGPWPPYSFVDIHIE